MSQFENKVPQQPVLGGRGQGCITTLLHMNRLNKTESVMFVSLMCSLHLEDLHQNLFSRAR